ncbi:MAG: efflux RND transporter periplasmic adaptor subunit [Xanthomonadales bacterium]|nr:efflux RND transporter periplasmic adaptor subunit [Xanthomonadales bacterium]
MKTAITIIIVAALAAAGYWLLAGDTDPAAGSGSWGQRGPVLVVAEPARIEPFERIVEAIGTTQANESVTITANLSDTVRRINFDDGDFVEAGTVLVELTNEEEEAQLAEARANLDDANRQLQRVRDLGGRGLAADSEVDVAVSAADAARARLNSVEARLQDRLIKAPFSGVLGFREVSIGTLVTPGTAITTLDDLSVVKLDFTVPETLLARLRIGFSVKATSTAWDSRVFEGQISSISSRIDPVTRAVEVRALIDNSDESLRPGMLMTVNVITDRRDVLAVSEAAVIQRSAANYVFTIDDERRAWRRDVTLGQRTYGRVEILSGLEAGELVVTEGTMSLRDGASVRLQGESPATASSPGQKGTGSISAGSGAPAGAGR